MLRWPLVEPLQAAEIRQVRISMGITQASLAEKLCVYTTTVQGWEAGRLVAKGLHLKMLRRWQILLAERGKLTEATEHRQNGRPRKVVAA